MTVYTCERCLKEFAQKSDYAAHQRRKTLCQDNSKKIANSLENKITETTTQVTPQISEPPETLIIMTISLAAAAEVQVPPLRLASSARPWAAIPAGQ